MPEPSTKKSEPLTNGTPASVAYGNNAVSQAFGSAAGGTGTGSSGGSGAGTGAFQGLPTPGPNDKHWTKAYQGFLKSGDVAGYKAYLHSTHPGLGI